MNDEHIKIIACDRGWAAVEKPCGISVHNDPGRDLLAELHKKISSSPQMREKMQIRKNFQIKPVHRLDRDTSGVILLAVDDAVLREFRKSFEQGDVTKQYIALVHGCFPLGETDDAPGMWSHPLSRNAGGRTHPAGTGTRLEAATCYQVLKQSPHYALLLVELLTGRTHQIRRHARLAGHPVTGDHRYGSPRSLKFLKENHGYTRLGLHAYSLEIRISGNNAPTHITSPGIPGEMVNLIREDSAD